MNIVMTGGGSGGHITPILAVATELKRLRPDIRIVYISQAGDSLTDVAARHPDIDELYAVRAGKFRRYHGEGWRQLLDLGTSMRNIRDAVWVAAGLWQSYWLLRRLKPSLIFSRGSYVSVPVCLAGKLLGVPFVTHDSDAIPSLTNRILSRFAALHAVALPADLYPYPIERTVTVGVPVSANYVPVTPRLQARYRRELGLGAYEQMVLITGGGLGAQRLNDAVVANAAFLLGKYPRLVLVHVTGRMHTTDVEAAYRRLAPAERGRAQVKGYIEDFYRYSGAADVVVARGGATNLAEFAIQGKACVIVPNHQLTGGHQLKNAEALSRLGAVISLRDEQIEQERRLGSVIAELLDSPARRQDLQKRLAATAHLRAAANLAELLLQEADPGGRLSARPGKSEAGRAG